MECPDPLGQGKYEIDDKVVKPRQINVLGFCEDPREDCKLPEGGGYVCRERREASRALFGQVDRESTSPQRPAINMLICQNLTRPLAHSGGFPVRFSLDFRILGYPSRPVVTSTSRRRTARKRRLPRTQRSTAQVTQTILGSG